MADAVIMPKAGMAMEHGQIIQWLKQEGDAVETGEPILEIETDKVAMEVEAERSGILLKITRGEGETVAVTETIGFIGDDGEQLPTEAPPAAGAEPAAEAGTAAGSDATQAVGATDQAGAAEPAARGADQAGHLPGAARPAGTKPKATPWARTLAGRRGVDLAVLTASGPHGEVKGRDVESAVSAAPAGPGAAGERGGLDVTPVARRIAEQEGVDLSTVTGTGPRGRVTKSDVLAAASGTAAATSAASGFSPAASGSAPATSAAETTQFTAMRRAIARNMIESHRTVPPVTLNGYAEVTRLLELRRELNAEEPEDKRSVTDFVLKATTEALRRHPGLNALADVEAGTITSYASVHLGVAVALPDGLIVPVVKNAETLSLGALGRRVQELAEAARSRSIGPDMLAGATFTVTNLGMYGVTTFTPIINPPQVGILGVGSIEDHLYRRSDGEIGERTTIGLSLTIDHRVVDGAQGAEFLATLRTLLEHPVRFLAG